VDGFSNALVVARVVRDSIVDKYRASGFAAHVLVSVVEARSNANSPNFCSLLSFRGDLLSLRTSIFMVGCVNVICSVSWAVLVALGGSNKWYHTPSMAPSKPRVTVITPAIGIAAPSKPRVTVITPAIGIAAPSKPRVTVITPAIGIALGMDCFDLSLYSLTEYLSEKQSSCLWSDSFGNTMHYMRERSSRCFVGV